jgi:hypothetical protein
MAKTRTLYRRFARKSGPSNAPAHSKQATPAFFDFGGGHSFFSGKSPEAAVNRKCDHCEKEDKVHKKENGASGNHASPQVSSQIKGLQGGAALPAATRQFFEPKFGTAFGDVKVHTNSVSHQLASSVNAKAFTYKNNIVFAKGQYDTESKSGKKLLAHELTHVVQQNGGVSKKETEKKEETIHRAPATDDLKIKGKDPGTAGDDGTIRFDAGQVDVTGAEKEKIKRQATSQKKVELNLNGFTSEEGTPVQNTNVVNARLDHVDSLLAAAGHQAIRHKKPDITAGEGNSNYRSRRIVEITPTFTKSGLATPSAIDPCTTKSQPCGTGLLDIVPLSMQKVVKAITALSTPDPATSAQLSTFFGATPAATVQANLAALLGEIVTLTMAHDPSTDCLKDTCDDTCSKGAAAYVNTNVVPAKMIFCASLLGAGPDERSETFIHESLHATPGVFTKDIAYAHTRKMLTMTDAEKLNNTDSYVMLIRMLHNPGATPTAPPKDAIGGTTSAAEVEFSKKAIAFLEQWLITSKFTSGGLYGEVNNALTAPAGWESPLAWFHLTMHDLSPLFGLTDPGTVAKFVVPKKDDKVRIAGIGDRYFRMREVLHSAPITLNKIATGPEKWSKELGNSVNVQASFFTKTDADAVKYLILLMLRSMSDVPSSLQNAYAEGSDKMRKQDKVGP